MSHPDDGLDSISVVNSSGSRNPRNNRSKFLSARSEADELRLEIARKDAEILELHCQIRLLNHQLCDSRGGVATLLRHLPGAPVNFPDSAPQAGAAFDRRSSPAAPALPRRPASPAQAFAVPDLPEPPTFLEGPRRVLPDPSVPQYAAPAPRPRAPISDRLEFSTRPGGFRGRSSRGHSSSPSERRSRSRGDSTPPPGSPEPPPRRFAQGPASRRPPYRH